MLKSITAIIKRIAAKTRRCGVNNVKENKSLKTITPKINNINKKMNKALRNVLKGILILYKSIKPVKPVKITDKVDTSISDKRIISGKIVMIMIFETIVKAVGKDLFNTLIII